MIEYIVGEQVHVKYGQPGYSTEYDGPVVGVSPDGETITVQCWCCRVAQPYHRIHISKKEVVQNGATKVQRG